MQPIIDGMRAYASKMDNFDNSLTMQVTKPCTEGNPAATIIGRKTLCSYYYYFLEINSRKVSNKLKGNWGWGQGWASTNFAMKHSKRTYM